MPTLSLTYWSAIVVAGALTLYFGGRQLGAARSVARLRDMSATGAFGYSLLVVSVYQGLALYFGPGATFFKWAVHGVVGFGMPGSFSSSSVGMSERMRPGNCSVQCR